jgi:hypothetical protein
MTKPYHQMTPAERTAQRIAKNRAAESRIVQSKTTVEGVIYGEDVFLHNEEEKFNAWRDQYWNTGYIVNCIGDKPYMLHHASCHTFRPPYTDSYGKICSTNLAYLLRNRTVDKCGHCERRGLL